MEHQERGIGELIKAGFRRVNCDDGLSRMVKSENNRTMVYQSTSRRTFEMIYDGKTEYVPERFR